MSINRIAKGLGAAWLGFSSLFGASMPTPESKVEWPNWMARHDMVFDRLPAAWSEAPHFGNGMLGSMLYRQGDALKLQVFRADVHDHRDARDGWTAYSRPRLRIGHFLLHPVGEFRGCRWRKDLWNAELTGVIETDRGEISIRHLVHSEEMAILTEWSASEGEQACRWSWHPAEARTTRSGVPDSPEAIERFARKYGDHYRETLRVYPSNPQGRLESVGDVEVWIQDFLVGGQYATAWRESRRGAAGSLWVSIAHSHPEVTAGREAVETVKRCAESDREAWIAAHRRWWHQYYPRSWISIPDPDLESLYWQTIYRFGCTSRTGRCMVDTPGIWFQGRSWPYFTSDWNIQSAHWPVYTANRLDQGRALVDRLHEQRRQLIEAVLPKAWREDSAFLPLAVAWDMRGSRRDDKRYFQLVGNLPWAMHNAWLHYRYSMDEALLAEKVFPLLRRSINFYLHMIRETDDGHLRLPPTYSPETGVWEDCAFDLALLKWGCHTLLKACERLDLDDPLIPRWKEVLARLPDYAIDEHGYMLGRNRTSSPNHQHFSNLLMIYPLHLVNVEQPDAPREVMRRSLARAFATAGPGQRQAMVQAHAGPMAAAMGLGGVALDSLERLQGDLYPNGLWYQSPCIESSLAAANIIQDMLLQSWSDPAARESGPIRVFPAMPNAWREAEFHKLRAEGGFLISAKMVVGQVQWVRIESLAGEPCRVRAGLGKRPRTVPETRIRRVAPETFEISLGQGEQVLLMPEQ